jgi:arylsulfatase A-like enzyme
MSLILPGLAIAASLSAQAADKPNVILVIWDTTRADHLSLYGHERPTTPNLDRIASNATVFEDAQASGYWTLPSAASLFTGLFGHNHKVEYSPYKTKDYSLELPDTVVTLAEALKEQGYRTGLFSASKLVSDNKSYSQGFDIYERSSEAPMGDKVLNFIDESGDQPWFTVMWYLTPHAPYEPDPEFDLWSLEGVAPLNVRGCNEDVDWKDHYYSQCDLNSGRIKLTDQQWEQLRRQYDGEVRRNDTRLGAFWKDLEERGIEDETLFVFTSDHGEAFAGHPSSMAWHGKPYWDNQTVPLVLRLPGKFPAKRIKSAVRTMDIYPTILELAGATVPSVINAESLMPTLSGNAPDRTNVGFNHGGLHYYRDSEHKLIFVRKDEKHPFHRPELYLIKTDPKEQNNVAPVNFAKANQVHESMMQFMEKTAVGHEQANTVNQDQIDLLREMGYVE